jgi:hypothetical protein
VIAYEDLRVKNLVKNHCLAKSINDAAWYQFREWIEYFGVKFGGSSVCVMQWTGVIRDGTLIEKGIASILANCFLSRAN